MKQRCGATPQKARAVSKVRHSEQHTMDLSISFALGYFCREDPRERSTRMAGKWSVPRFQRPCQQETKEREREGQKEKADTIKVSQIDLREQVALQNLRDPMAARLRVDSI